MWKTHKNYKFYTTLPDKPKWDAVMEWWLNNDWAVRSNPYYRSPSINTTYYEDDAVWCSGVIEWSK